MKVSKVLLVLILLELMAIIAWQNSHGKRLANIESGVNRMVELANKAENRRAVQAEQERLGFRSVPGAAKQ